MVTFYTDSSIPSLGKTSTSPYPVYKHSPGFTAFDLLFKNLFEKDGEFLPVFDAKIGHPVDIYEDKEGLHLDIACTGIPKEDIEVKIEGDILRVIYEKPKEEISNDITYQQRGITRKSFNLGWKLASRFDLDNSDARFVNGLLEILVPIAATAKPKTLKIK